MATGKDASELGECTDLLNLAADKARRYVQSIADRRVSPSEAALAALAELHEPFPLSPCGPTVVINRLDEIGSAATVDDRRALLRFCEWRNGARSAGRQLASGGVEPECGIARDVSNR